MADAGGVTTLLRLTAWLSPAFPVGSFSYSHGLERAVQDGLVRGSEDLRQWLASLVEHGSAWNDAVFLAEAMRRARACEGLADLAELAEALAGSAERHVETCLQGRAFLGAAGAWPNGVLARLPANCPYAVAVGSLAGAMRLPATPALAAFLHAFASNLVQAAIRLGIAGQSDGVRTIAALEPVIAATAERAAKSTLEDLGSATLLAEITSMRHETQYSRLFRT